MRAGEVTHWIEESPAKHRIGLCDDLGEPTCPAACLLLLEKGGELVEAHACRHGIEQRPSAAEAEVAHILSLPCASDRREDLIALDILPERSASALLMSIASSVLGRSSFISLVMLPSSATDTEPLPVQQRPKGRGDGDEP